MNIIEAAKALKEGKTIVDSVGFRFRHADFYENEIIFTDGSDGWFTISDLLSEKWTVVDE